MVTQGGAIDLFYPMAEGKKSKQKQLEINNELQKLGNRIKALRLERGYTSYEHFAYAHDISRAQFGRYERGLDLRYSTLIRIINAFEITVEEFFGEGFE